MKRNSSNLTLVLLCLSPLAAFAEGDSIEISRPSFTVFTEFGSFRNGTEFDNVEFSHYWVQRSGVWLNFAAKKNERFGMDVLLGGIFWNPTYNENSSSENVLRYFAAAAPRLDVSYTFGDLQAPFLKVNGGILQYKYNEYARNLGEYVFRTAAYPELVYTGALTYVDMNKASITGLKITHNLSKMFSHDLILNTETDLLPHYDLTLSYIAKVNWRGIVKSGAGVEFARILPIRPSFTNPDVQLNRHFTFNDTTYLDNFGYYPQRIETIKTTPGAILADTMSFQRGRVLADTLRTIQIDNPSITFAQALDTLDRFYSPSSPSTYSYFKSSSITPVFFFSFDPKPLLPLDIFGPKDLVFYGEAAVLGWENQPILYEKRGERTIVMGGINIPAFKFLDVLAMEVEYFPSRLPASSQFSQRDIPKRNGILQPIPQPSIYAGQLSQGYSPDGYSHYNWWRDDWKWSVLAQRRIVSGLTAIVQVADDHARGWVFPSGRRYWELFRNPSDWYWMFKLTANI